MSQINRRSVVRGAAWSVPVVAAAAHAPAYAASTDPPTIAGPSAFAGSCKQPGGPNTVNCQGYRLSINFSVQPGDPWNITFTDVVLNGTSYISGTSPKTVTGLTTTSSMVTLVVCTNTNSQGPVTAALTYTATNTRTNVTTTVSTGTIDLGVVPPCS
ncbi:hypothetical protein [Nocardioides xinjiangensis]|uniref:hypothetical protein n=1 Tax=Nocardioides xinjiangensis TaxID=2817376 RepID=UPI001B309204|nr:hypothetical protein [Nocardioides sp. SYSU D00514]